MKRQRRVVSAVIVTGLLGTTALAPRVQCGAGRHRTQTPTPMLVPAPAPSPGPTPEPEPSLAPPARPGPSERLWPISQHAVRWHAWRQSHHPWWQQVQAKAQQPVDNHDGDAEVLGQWEALAYAMSGDVTYAASAWQVLKAYFLGGYPGQDQVRERFPDAGWVYTLLQPALTASQRREFIDTVNLWAQRCIDGTIPWDSDQVVGCYVGTVLAMEATRADNPQAASFLSHRQMATWKSAIEDWIRKNAAGGVWIESSQYNLGTPQFLVLAAAQLDWPLADAWVYDLAEAELWNLTPDLRQPVMWGDAQQEYRDGNLALHRRGTLLWLLTSLPGPEGDRVRQLARDLGAGPERPRSVLLGRPDLPGAEWRSAATGARFFPGQGILLHRTATSQFQAQAQPWPDVDHQLFDMGDWSLYRNGEFVVPTRAEYDDEDGHSEWHVGNNLLLYGQPSMRESRGWVFHQETGPCSILTGWTGGNRYHEGSVDNTPNRWVHEWSRAIAFCPSARSDVVVIFDRIRQDDPTGQLERFQPRERALVQAYPPLVGFLNAAAVPSLRDRTVSWTTPGGQPVTMQQLLPADVHLSTDGQAVQWQPGARRPMECALGVLSAGEPATVTQQDNLVTITRAGIADVTLRLDLTPATELPDSRYDGGQLVADRDLYRRVGRPAALQVE